MTRLAALAAISLLALPAAAQTLPAVQPGEVQSRFNEQQERINQGVRSGSLTPAEAARDEAHLRADERVRNQDLRAHGGHLTPAEQARLNQRLNHNSRRIHETKHNGVSVPPRR